MSEGLWENEIKAIGNWEKWSPCYVITISLATLSPELPWKVENVPIELCDIAKEIIIQSAKGMVWFLLVSYSKMQEEIDKFLKGQINKKEPGLDVFENSWLLR